MIFEAIQHILTPAPKAVKAMGYVREAIAIEARFQRCQVAWQPHLNACQHQILTAAKHLKPGSKITILGSGALHDVPLDGLLALGHHVQLVDIVHLPKIKKKYGTHPRVNIIERDVTGLVIPLYDKESLTAEGFVEKLPLLEATDLIISLNILSQLSIPLKRYTDKENHHAGKDFDQSIMKAHLKLLERSASKILIISDLQRLYGTEQEIIEQENALPQTMLTTLGSPLAQWDWMIAPRGEVDRKITITHRVACWTIPTRPQSPSQ